MPNSPDHAATLRALVDQLRVELNAIVENDATQYDHHQARPFDGKRPTSGSCWLTPRQIAERALNRIESTAAPARETPEPFRGGCMRCGAEFENLHAWETHFLTPCVRPTETQP